MSKTQTTREMLTSHIKRLKTRRAELAEAMAKRLENFQIAMVWDMHALRAGGKPRCPGKIPASSPAASFDVQCAVLCELDQEIEELEAIMELSQ